MQRKSRHNRHEGSTSPRAKRPAWRQRLIQAERGISNGLKGDSTFFVHFFATSIVLAAGAVMGLEILQWGLVALSLALVFSAEMFNQALKAILQSEQPNPPDNVKKALGISTAAVLFSIIGAVITLALVFWQRAADMFHAS